MLYGLLNVKPFILLSCRNIAKDIGIDLDRPRGRGVYQGGGRVKVLFPISTSKRIIPGLVMSRWECNECVLVSVDFPHKRGLLMNNQIQQLPGL